MRPLKELLIIVRDELEKKGYIVHGLCLFSLDLHNADIISWDEYNYIGDYFMIGAEMEGDGNNLFPVGEYEPRLNWINQKINNL